MKAKAPTRSELSRALYGNGRKRANLETQLVRSILDNLGVMGIAAFRRNVGALEYLDAQQKRRLVHFGSAGMADIWGVTRTGRHIEIEAKVPGEKPSSEQLAWLDRMTAYGAIAFWTDDIDECMATVRAHLEQKPALCDKRWDGEGTHQHHCGLAKYHDGVCRCADEEEHEGIPR